VPARAASFAAFESASPAFGAAARRLFVGADGVAIGFLATVSERGRPHLAPVCPVFCGDDLFVVAAARSPRTADLRTNSAFVLHAFLGQSDEELQLAGRAVAIEGPDERAAVHAAIPFASFQRTDPIFRLDVERALWVYWERAGQPDTKAVRRRWP
jgi:Pyridoxamine 5'-phosphate oxidase